MAMVWGASFLASSHALRQLNPAQLVAGRITRFQMGLTALFFSGWALATDGLPGGTLSFVQLLGVAVALGGFLICTGTETAGGSAHG